VGKGSPTAQSFDKTVVVTPGLLEAHLINKLR
jgi:hypothetical protein